MASEMGNTAADTYVLRLFVAGESPRSLAAISVMRHLCFHSLRNAYRLEIIDVFDRPQAAEDEHILATPTLIKSNPQPSRRIVGDLLNIDQTLLALGLPPNPLPEARQP